VLCVFRLRSFCVLIIIKDIFQNSLCCCCCFCLMFFENFFFFFARRWSDKSDEIAAYKFDFAVVRFKDFFLIVVRERKEHARDDI